MVCTARRDADVCVRPLCTTGVCVVFADGILWCGREDGLRFVGAATNVEVRTCAVAPAITKSPGPDDVSMPP